MGTRNLTCVALDGELKVAQYGQWDGYPSFQGKIVMQFVKNTLLEKDNIDIFRGKVSALTEYEESAVETLWRKAEKERAKYRKRLNTERNIPDGEYNIDVELKVNKFMPENYPAITRDTGAKILQAVFDDKTGGKIILNKDFAADSLFCEYAYVVDLDNNTVEFYKGFVQEPHNDGRFSDMAPDGSYYPIKLLKTYSFAAIKNTTVEELVEDMEKISSPEEVEA